MASSLPVQMLSPDVCIPIWDGFTMFHLLDDEDGDEHTVFPTPLTYEVGVILSRVSCGSLTC